MAVARRCDASRPGPARPLHGILPNDAERRSGRHHVDRDLRPATLIAWNGRRPGLQRRWTGTLCPLRAGAYVRADADAAADILMDGRDPAPGTSRSGAHPGLIRWHAPCGRPGPVRLLWARDHEPPRAGAQLRCAQEDQSVPRAVARGARPRAGAERVGLGRVPARCSPPRRWRARVASPAPPIARKAAWPTLRRILAGSLVLNLAASGGDCRAAGWRSSSSRNASSPHSSTSSRGWFDAHPPVHFYLIAGRWSPLLLLSGSTASHLRRASHTPPWSSSRASSASRWPPAWWRRRASAARARSAAAPG
jgi:hypothetical protein